MKSINSDVALNLLRTVFVCSFCCICFGVSVHGLDVLLEALQEYDAVCTSIQLLP